MQERFSNFQIKSYSSLFILDETLNMDNHVQMRVNACMKLLRFIPCYRNERVETIKIWVRPDRFSICSLTESYHVYGDQLRNVTSWEESTQE